MQTEKVLVVTGDRGLQCSDFHYSTILRHVNTEMPPQGLYDCAVATEETLLVGLYIAC